MERSVEGVILDDYRESIDIVRRYRKNFATNSRKYRELCDIVKELKATLTALEKYYTGYCMPEYMRAYPLNKTLTGRKVKREDGIKTVGQKYVYQCNGRSFRIQK